MEITLEKIELVKDRTGVSYKEAKDALEAAEGSVVDAIIAIEDTVDEKPAKKVNEAANETVDKIKDMVKKGNISKITGIRKGINVYNFYITVFSKCDLYEITTYKAGTACYQNSFHWLISFQKSEVSLIFK